MKTWREFFKGKKVTLMGLGLLGRGVGDAAFLARMGAEVLVTDLKTAKELAPSVQRLKKFKNIKFYLGGHRLEDFRTCDFVVKAAGVPLDSPYIAEARKHGIPIEMDASLFFKLMPKGVTFIGVTGTRGKTTTAYLIYETLKKDYEHQILVNLRGSDARVQKVYLAGNIKDTATLPLLEKVSPPAGGGDFVVAELDSWQLQGFGDSKISPPIAIFTTFLPDHMNYYRSTSLATSMAMYFSDKANIFKFQKKSDILVVGEQALSVRSDLNSKKGQTLIADASYVPKDWKLKIIGEHNRANAACALCALDTLRIPREISKKTFENFKGVSGRLEFLREIRGVKIYNDNNATTPDATIAALRALASQGSTLVGKKVEPLSSRIVLIMGGTDKGLNMSGLISAIPKYCKTVILLDESGTRKIRNKIYDLRFKHKTLGIKEADSLEKCVREAMKIAKKGDIILFSPAFASFSKWFKNEYDRGEQFVELVKQLKDESWEF